jgi:uncharacterized protein
LRWIIFLLLYLLVDFYAYQGVKTLSRHPLTPWLFFGASFLVLGLFVWQITLLSDQRNTSPLQLYTFGVFLAFFVPKLIVFAILLTEDLIRLPWGLWRHWLGTSADVDGFLPSRRLFVSRLALGLAALPFGALLYGMIRGKYQYQVLKYQLSFADLPEAFDGYTITQISDLHCGSFDDEQKVAYGINLIQEQDSDLIVFTGDLVNNKAEELDRWQKIFGQLTAPDGVFSVLGNHDYGDYVPWPSAEAKSENLDRLKQGQQEMGWRLLLNEQATITKGDDKIHLVGVENWGAGGFKKSGDLVSASSGLAPDDFKILLSHDPSHWEQQVKDNDQNFHLTLSGHTHGMQFGVEIPGWFKWSPVKYRYPYWAGIYKNKNRFLNVNRGFGFLGYPGRVGIKPEVTVIQLKKSENIG